MQNVPRNDLIIIRKRVRENERERERTREKERERERKREKKRERERKREKERSQNIIDALSSYSVSASISAMNTDGGSFR